MDIFYKKIKANVTPEVLAQLHSNLKHAPNSDFKGGSPEENLAISLNILNGKDQSSRRDVVLLNAGLSLYVAEKVDTIAEGIELATTLIDNGEALEKYHQMRGE
ncbi:hypothetical protein ACIWLS_000830 [Staphylococcus aureus]